MIRTMTSAAPRIALIHATALSMLPIDAAFERHWPQARRMNLLDDSLSVDRAQAGKMDDAMVQRFVDLAGYVVRTGCSGICDSLRFGVPKLCLNHIGFEIGKRCKYLIYKCRLSFKTAS